MKPLKVELLDKMFQYISIFGVISEMYVSKNAGGDDNDDGDSKMCALKDFLCS